MSVAAKAEESSLTRELIASAVRSIDAADQFSLPFPLYQASLKGLLHIGSYGLEPVKTLPFLPNVGYAFVVLKAYHSLMKMSWHGRPKITTPIDHPRVSLLNTFYVSEDVGF
nr:hypothetical protein [Mesorhizobium sp.]